jgi:hypothetical protein
MNSKVSWSYSPWFNILQHSHHSRNGEARSPVAVKFCSFCSLLLLGNDFTVVLAWLGTTWDLLGPSSCRPWSNTFVSLEIGMALTIATWRQRPALDTAETCWDHAELNGQPGLWEVLGAGLAPRATHINTLSSAILLKYVEMFPPDVPSIPSRASLHGASGVSNSLFWESICSPGLKGHGLSGPFQLYSKRCRSWLIHVFFAFTFPFDSRGFFITQDHVESCRCFMLWDQQIPLFSVFWATHHFLMCPKCNVSYVSKMQRQMVNNTFVSHVSMCLNQETYMPCSSGIATIFPVTQHSLGI